VIEAPFGRKFTAACLDFDDYFHTLAYENKLNTGLTVPERAFSTSTRI
jgi:hypothetical protein